MATEEQHAAAVKTALNALLSPAVAYEYDDLPAARPDNYVELSVQWRAGGDERVGGGVDGELRYISVRSVGKTLTNARTLQDRAVGLIGTTLTVNGRRSTPIKRETSADIAPDDGWYSGLTLLTYALL